MAVSDTGEAVDAPGQRRAAGAPSEATGLRKDAAGAQNETAGAGNDGPGASSEATGPQKQAAGSQNEAAGPQKQATGSQKGAAPQKQATGAQKGAAPQKEATGSQKGAAPQKEATGSQKETEDGTPSLRELLATGSRPLVIPSHRMLVFWSPKSGCTFILKWALRQTGLLRAANFYSPWPHDYRMQVYYESRGYRRAIAAFVADPGPVIKLVRNPYSRAVSSFIHVVRTGYADGWIRTTEQRKSEGISFRDFISWLESEQDLRRCNPHHGLQYHRAEQALRIDHVIHLEKAIDELQLVCERYDLNGKNLEGLSRSHHHTHRALSGVGGPDVRCRGDEAAYADFDAFYDEDARRRVHALYATDFEAYCYSAKLPEAEPA